MSAPPIPDGDRQKAKAFFDRAKTVGDTSQFDYAISLFVDGLNLDPESIDAHLALRELSLKRKMSGGKPLGMFQLLKLRNTKDEKQNMLNAAKCLAYDPGNTDHMVSMLQSAHKAGFHDTVKWMAGILMRANADSKSPEAKKFLILKEVYSDLEEWKLAIEACTMAARLQPDNMDLNEELKNLSARLTMKESRYGEGDFTKSLKNQDEQQANIERQKDVVSTDALGRLIRNYEADYKANPSDLSRLHKLVDALERTEDPEHENRAIEVLDEAYQRTDQFSLRHRIGQLKMGQLRRMERSMRAALEADPKDEGMRQACEQFKAEQLDFELKEYTLWAEKYPTELKHRYEAARRLFALQRYDEAIPLFQQSRNDPKLRNDSTIWLGCAFLEAGFADEAVETLQGVIDEYQIKGDDRSKQMYYWQGRAYEAKANNEMAIKRFSQVAQWEFTYKDVQQRIKKLRSSGGGAK